jgi:hypothetical protein
MRIQMGKLAVDYTSRYMPFKNHKKFVLQWQKIYLSVLFYRRLTAFQKRTDALAVCLIFDASCLPGYQGPGYHYQVGCGRGGRKLVCTIMLHIFTLRWKDPQLLFRIPNLRPEGSGSGIIFPDLVLDPNPRMDPNQILDPNLLTK